MLLIIVTISQFSVVFSKDAVALRDHDVGECQSKMPGQSLLLQKTHVTGPRSKELLALASDEDGGSAGRKLVHAWKQSFRADEAINMTVQDINEVINWQPWRDSSERERMFQKVLSMEGDPNGRSIPIMALGEMGFAARMNYYVLGVMFAMKMNVPALACERLEKLRPFFVNRHNNRQNRSCPQDWPPTIDGMRLSEPCETMLRANLSHPSGAGVPSLFNQVEDMKRYIYHELFTPTQEFSDHVWEAQRNMGLANGRYIGVHIRHGGAGAGAREEQLALQGERDVLAFAEYALAIKEASDETGITTVFVASDDPQAREQMQQLLGGFRVEEQPRLDDSSYNDRIRYPEETVAQLLTDMSLLIKAEVFIGTATSNVGRLVYWQRDPRRLSISLQSGWEFGMCGV